MQNVANNVAIKSLQHYPSNNLKFYKIAKCQMISEILQKNKQLLDEVIQLGKSITFPRKDNIDRLLKVFLDRQLSLATSINILLRKKQYYESCMLIPTLLENHILVIYLISFDKIIDYLEYACIESLPRLKIYPEEKAETLNFIKNHNVVRFFNDKLEKSDDNLLNPKNYKKAPWYNIESMVQQLISKGNVDIRQTKDHYDLFCAYKHSQPFNILQRMTFERIDNDAVISSGVACCALLQGYPLILSKHPLEYLIKKQRELTDQFNGLQEEFRKNYDTFKKESELLYNR